MIQKPLLSVIIISYNQEKYIRDAIDSVLMQKVDFKYELILADDCSPDNTKKILEEYKKKYPDIIRIAHRPKNMGATNNLLDACKMSLGKYVTILEGDDYWCNENKLQIQVDFLEQNKEFIGFSHLQEGRDMANNFIGNFPKWVKADYDMTIDDVCRDKYYSSTATVYHNIYINKKYLSNIEYLFGLDKTIGDAQLCAYLLSLGKVHISNEAMMVYRCRNSKNETNYNSTHTISQIQMSYLKIYKELDKFFDGKFDFLNNFKEHVTLGCAYSICKFNFKGARSFIAECPKKYRYKIILLMPFTSVKILYNRFVKK